MSYEGNMSEEVKIILIDDQWAEDMQKLTPACRNTIINIMAENIVRVQKQIIKEVLEKKINDQNE